VSSGADGLSAKRIAVAVSEAGLAPLPSGVAERFSAYFDLLNRWNARLNLTAIREPEGTLRRHFLECIFCAQILPPGIGTLLDYGSGAGFPGLPIALCRPEIRVTLAESHGKKASFLREAVRVLALEVEVYAGRVEEMATGRLFDGVALRAVDKMREAVRGSSQRVAVGGWLVLMVGAGKLELPMGFFEDRVVRVPGSSESSVVLANRSEVPR
jgi:16S rRNA (guanine527-N7)-methyltransferase